jgi:hypothetical protein
MNYPRLSRLIHKSKTFDVWVDQEGTFCICRTDADEVVIFFGRQQDAMQYVCDNEKRLVLEAVR